MNRNGKSMLDMPQDEVFPSRWLRALDLQGRSIVVEVAEVRVEEVRDPRTFQPTQKIVVYFRGAEKALIPNKTQFGAFCACAHVETAREWIGKRYLLSPTTFRGKNTIAVSSPPIQRKNGQDIDVTPYEEPVRETAAADTPPARIRESQKDALNGDGKGFYGKAWPEKRKELIASVTKGRTEHIDGLTQGEADMLIKGIRAKADERREAAA